ncbi:hypothetical protein OG613_06220 [Streptomyces sp. NBC_00015]|uniref:hypothetical protein n=1 Tax=Streptomyces sp. NBC_00015 TaxID=2903611 RepID=UPI0032506C0E
MPTDELTITLHLADVTRLLNLLDRLVDTGRSGIVIGHHQAVVAHVDLRRLSWPLEAGRSADTNPPILETFFRCTPLRARIGS